MANTFITYDVALELCRAVRPLLERFTDRDLADQLRRAVASVPLNLAEGNRRRGADRRRCFRIAAGSADEVRAALDVADALGSLGGADGAVARALADRVLRMLWPLTR